MKSIKTIIVPTDFSKAADSALNYAIKFANLVDAKIILYHSFIPFDSGFYSPIQNEIENLEIEKGYMNRLNNIKNEFSKKYKDVTIGIQVDRGSSKSQLIEYAEDKKCGLMIMGTKGAGNLKDSVLGSFTSHIMNYSKCPVLAIPRVSKYKVPKKITFASNYEANDTLVIQKLLEFNSYFKAKISIVHVDKDDFSHKLKAIAFNKYKFKINKHFKDSNITFKHIGGKNTVESLLRSTLNDKTEMLVISPIKKEGMWGKLFHKSFTKEIAGQIHMPILSIPNLN